MSFLCGAPAGRPTRDEETGAYDHNIDWPGLETSELIPLSDAAAGGEGSLDEALLTQRRVLFGDVVGSQHGYSATIVVWTRALGSVAAERQASAFLEVLADVCAAHVRLVFIAPPGSAADASSETFGVVSLARFASALGPLRMRPAGLSTGIGRRARTCSVMDKVSASPNAVACPISAS